jgi:hypothetical protein
MAACFVHFRQVRRPKPPQSDWIMALLEDAGVTSGIQEPALERLCRLDVPLDHVEAIELAAGRPPVPGVDAHLDAGVDLGKRSGRILPDGSIDLRARNAAVAVEEGQFLGRLVPPTEGEPGLDLGGETLETTDGQTRDFSAGDNVRAEDGAEGTAFYAEVDGAASMKGDALQVLPVLIISGDVDYDTGNLETSSEVQISGSVKSGFSVQARGAITVAGVVEDGAELRSGGDVVVGQGVLGETSRIVASGDVEVKYVQNATVLAQGDVTVGSYIYNAAVRAGGRVRVSSSGGERAGSIVGGEVVAARGVEAAFLGSSTTDRTVVGVGPDPESAARLQKARKTQSVCDGQIARLLRTLGVEEPDAQRLKQAIAHAAPQRRQQLIDAVRKLDELIPRRQAAVEEQQGLAESIAEIMTEADVRATSTAFREVVVTFGEDLSRVSEDLSGPLFYVTDQGVRYRPL